MIWKLAILLQDPAIETVVIKYWEGFKNPESKKGPKASRRVVTT